MGVHKRGVYIYIYIHTYIHTKNINIYIYIYRGGAITIMCSLEVGYFALGLFMLGFQCWQLAVLLLFGVFGNSTCGV